MPDDSVAAPSGADRHAALPNPEQPQVTGTAPEPSLIPGIDDDTVAAVTPTAPLSAALINSMLSVLASASAGLVGGRNGRTDIYGPVGNVPSVTAVRSGNPYVGY